MGRADFVRWIAGVDSEDRDGASAFYDPGGVWKDEARQTRGIAESKPFLDGVHLVTFDLEVVVDDIKAEREAEPLERGVVGWVLGG